MLTNVQHRCMWMQLRKPYQRAVPQWVHYLHQSTDEYEEDYFTLCLSKNCDAAAVRDAFLRLAKLYHPDGDSAYADPVKFHRVERSYRRLLRKFAAERHNQSAAEGEYGLYYKPKQERTQGASHPDEELQGPGFYNLKRWIEREALLILCRVAEQRSAPQHRQYLSYEGVGMGTPSQRQRQFNKFKTMRASENVIDFKVQQLQVQYPEESLIARDQLAARKIKTRYGIERVVEDLILESMARGDFDNLPNAGKPLKYDIYNPYLDITTQKLNQVLIDNGYAPAWVQLEKEIREEKLWLQDCLEKYRAHLPASPLPPQQMEMWKEFVLSLTPYLKELNKRIDSYNLVVPILSKQMMHFPYQEIAERVLSEGVSCEQPDASRLVQRKTIVPNSFNSISPAAAPSFEIKPKSTASAQDSLLSAILSIFKN